MKTTKQKHFKWRIYAIGVFFGVLIAGITARAVQVQVFQSQWLSRQAAAEYRKSLVSYGKRGTIYDANFQEMAVSIDVMSIAAFPARIKDARSASAMLSKVLKIKRNRLERILSSRKSFVWIQRHASPKEITAVKNLALDGVEFLPEHSRYYPNKTLAAQTLGFAGTDGNGLEGIEFVYNSTLKGNSTTFTVLKDALGRGFDSRQNPFMSFNGNDVILTIDQTIQYIAENALQEAAVTHNAESGIAVVMSPDTGALLAIAHYPAFNPNSFRNFKRSQWRNRAITDSFEPGSTLKVILASAAIESGYCHPNSIFYCENGSYRIGPNTIHDTHPRGWLSLQQIVKYSSNIGVTKVSETIGRKTLYDTLKAFGFGSKTGIDCPGETSGSLSSWRRWKRIDTAAISFGQGISVSAIQLVTAVSAIANGGKLMRPYMVQGITDSTGNIDKMFSPQVIRQVISPTTAKKVRKIMHTVVTEGGTGVNAALDDYSVCGKTGTAQKLENGRYSNSRFISSFIGFAPQEKPEITVLVLLDEPRKGHYGGVVAAPAFKKIVYEAINYLHTASGRGTEKLLVNAKNEVSG